MKTKLFTLLFAIVASIGTIFAESGTRGENLTWDLTDGVLTISGTGAMNDYAYDRSRDYLDSPWWYQRASITSVVISDGVTSIGQYAFYRCTGLTSVTIPNSVTSIGNSAFNGCRSLTSVPIPNSIISIGANAFSGCNVNEVRFSGTINEWCTKPWSPSSLSGSYHLYINDAKVKALVIPNDVTSIGQDAFNGCTGLTSVTIPNSVTSIGNSAFNGCSSLTSVTIGESVTSIGQDAFNGCTGLTSVAIPNSVTSIGESAFSNCSGLTSVTLNSNAIVSHSYLNNSSIKDFFGNQVTEYLLGDDVKSIGQDAFNGCTGLTSVTIPNSVTSIGESAFSNCTGLISVIIPNTVTSIGNSAFNGCSSLTSVTIGESVTSIGQDAFNGCSSLTSVTIGESVTSIGNSAFNGCSSLTSVTIGESVTSIGSNAFKDCTMLTSVTLNSNAIVSKSYIQDIFGEQVKKYVIGDGVTSIGAYAFYNCSGLTSVTIPNSVTRIGNSAFSNCSRLTSVTIPNSVTSIGSNAFNGCSSLTSVTIPNSVTSIGEGAFSKCSSLTSVTIPNSITRIGNSAFDNCTGLTSVTIPNSVTSIGAYAFYNCSGLTSVTIPNSVTSIGNRAFNGCSSLTSVTIPNSVTSIGESAFSNCSRLTSVTIPNSVTSIGNSAFNGCSSLTSVTIGNSVTSIGGSTFSNCSRLTSVTIGESVTSIGESAFSNCSRLTSVTIPNSVTSVENKAFYRCTGLTSITIPNNVTSIGSNAFEDCSNILSVVWNAKNCNAYNFGTQVTSFTLGENVEVIPSRLCYGMNQLTSITIPNSVTSIGDYAFYQCTSLTSINIPNSVTSIGNSTFCGCTSLTSVTIGNSVTSIGYSAFDGCSSLTSVTINSNAIMSRSYTGNSNIRTIFGAQVSEYIIGDSVTKIGNMAFYKCTSLISVSIGDRVARIGNGAFKGCENVGTLSLPSSLKFIGDEAFSNWQKITKLHIPNNVDTIGARAFENCIYITSIYLGNKMTEIGDYAFNGCTRVNDITCMNTVTPTVYANTLSSINSLAYLYVLAGSKRTYQLDPYWGRFDIQELTTNESTLPKDEVIIEAHDDNAVFTWPMNTAAATYSLQITKDGEVFCTLTFNSNGQLTGIAFAPSRNGAPHTPAATTSISGMSFTVTGLDVATRYEYNLTIKDNQQQVIKDYSGRFATQGYVPEKYTITFVNWDGTVLKTEQVEEGTIPSYTGATPTRQETAEFTYTFAGWTPEIAAATSDATYTATYTATRKSYTITWLQDDGSLIDQTTVEYGQMPTHADPTKAATSEYSYTFTGWTPEIVVVTGDATYTAQYIQGTPGATYYIVTFKDWDGTVLKTQPVEEGKSATAPANPTREGYTFIGWDKDFSHVLSDLTVIALYTQNAPSITYYTVTFKDWNGTVLKAEQVENGKSATAPANPTREGYTFIGWDKSSANVQSDLIVTAQYIQNSPEPSGETMSFVGFESTSENPLSNQIYAENLIQNKVNVTLVETDATKHKYSINLTNGGEGSFTMGGVSFSYTYSQAGKTAYKTYIEYIQPNGADREISIPTKTGEQVKVVLVEACAGVLVNGVSTDLVAGDNVLTSQNGTIVLKSASTKPKISAILPLSSTSATNYTVAFVDWDATVLKTQQVTKGQSATAPANPTREDYTFTGWDKDFSNVQSDLIVIAQYTQNAPIYYTVTFKDWDGTVLKNEQVERGKSATAPANPTREGYTFVGWDKYFGNVRSDLIVTALYTQNASTYYTVTFKDWDGTVLKTEQVEEGTIPSYTGATPTRQETAEFTYTFAGWTPEIAAATSDATYTATYTATRKSYTITWLQDDGSLIDQTTVEYGQMPTHADPTKAATAEYTYTFAGWSPEIVVVTKDATYTATYEATPVSEGVEDVSADDIAPRKVMIDGNVYILRGEKVYTVQGQEVK